MRSGLAVLLLTLLPSAAVYSASPPRPAKSEYLITTGAGFLLEKERGAYYGMNFSIRKPLPGAVYLVALFDNPEVPDTPLRTELVVPADATEIQFQSPGVHQIGNNKRYEVRLTLYLDADRTKVLGTHRQDVLFSMPPAFLIQLFDQFGVAVL